MPASLIAAALALFLAAHDIGPAKAGAGTGPAAADRTVAIVSDGAMLPPARHGIARLQEVLRARGLEVVDGSRAASAEFVVLTGACSGIGAAAKALTDLKVVAPEGAEALAIRRNARHLGKPAVALCGADTRGLMYAALDTAERIGWSTDVRNPFEHVRETTEQPFLAERGVSMYTMHRAYFESRLYDERHWMRYFDLLAASRINNFIVIFGYENGGFMAPPYPYFFDVEQFPDVQLVGLTREQQARNTAAFKTMMRLAHERGISVTAAIWDHIYRGGVQTGGIPGAPKGADARVPGLVWGVTGENLPAYTKAALRSFLQVFPEVDAIQFRMHEESGLRQQEIVSFWHEVFGLIKEARPDMRLDLRAKGLPDAVIEDALKQGLDARVSTKFWMEQMGLPFHPTHVNPQNQRDRRHGYADLLRYPQRYRVHWQLWSGGTTRLLLWGDPDYVRRFAGVARLYGGNSFDVNEMLATKMLGEPHGDRPIDVLNPGYRYYEYEFERYWHFYQLWGRLTYDPRAPSDIWEHEFTKRFGAPAGAHLMKAQHLASRILPRIVASSYRYAYFPTTRGWPEMKRQDDLATFAGAEGSDTQQFMNPRDAARSMLNGSATAMRRPEETSRWFAETSDAILAELAQAEKHVARSFSAADGGSSARNEVRSTATDLKILAALARYYSSRLPAAVSYNLYKESGDVSSLDAAIANEKRAIQAWGDIVQAAADVYHEKLPFGAPGHFPRHWKEELQRLQQDLERLRATRPTASAGAPAPGGPSFSSGVTDDNAARKAGVNVTGTPPAVTLQPVSEAVPGRDVVVSAKVSAAAGIGWVRLRYRHLTQFEDYESAEMTLNPATGLYAASIPASFVDTKWDLMYFVEAVDRSGTGRMYPDLGVETPYVVIPVRR